MPGTSLTTNVGIAGGGHGAVRALGTPQAKLKQLLVGSSDAVSHGVGGHKAGGVSAAPFTGVAVRRAWIVGLG